MILLTGRLRIELTAKKCEPLFILVLGMVSNHKSHFLPGYGTSFWEKISIERESDNVSD